MSERLPAGPDERAGRAQAARTLGLVPSLDGIRGIGIMVVVFVHLDPFIHTWTDKTPGLFIFMNVFFVMSGFLITAILLREHDRMGRIRLKHFYQGRVLRLFPALCAMVAVEFIWASLRHYPLDYEYKAMGSALTYLSNWGLAPWRVSLVQQARYPTGTGQLWSLAVEEQFYLFWPLALIGLLAVARRFRFAPLIVVSVVIVVVAVRRAVVYFGIPAATFQTYGWSTLYQRTDYPPRRPVVGRPARHGLGSRLDPPPRAGGRGLDRRRHPGDGDVHRELTTGWMYVWGMPVMAMATVAVVLACVEADWPLKRLLETRWLCAIGVVSYGIYVWHLLADAMVTAAGPHWPAGVQVLAAVGLTAAFAARLVVPDREALPADEGPAAEPRPFAPQHPSGAARRGTEVPADASTEVPADTSTDVPTDVAELFEPSPRSD